MDPQKKHMPLSGFGRELFTTEGHETIKELRQEGEEADEDKASIGNNTPKQQLEIQTDNGFLIEKQTDSKQGMFDIRENGAEEFNTPKGQSNRMQSQMPQNIANKQAHTINQDQPDNQFFPKENANLKTYSDNTQNFERLGRIQDSSSQR